MATNAPAAPAEPDSAAPQDQAPKKKFSLSGKKVKILALLLVVMGAQTAVVYLILPAPTNGAAESAGHDAEHGEASSSGHGDGHLAGRGGTEEVEISDFSSSVSANSGGSIIFVTFRLFATVPSSSRADFEKYITQSHKARVHQAVVKVIRMSSMDDLNDPQLDVFKRNLRTEINNVLPQRYVNEVVISEFRTMEQ